MRCVLRGVSGCLQSAIDADPKNPLAKFEKAAVLMSQEQYQPALAELEALKACFCPQSQSPECTCWQASLRAYILAALFGQLDASPST